MSTNLIILLCIVYAVGAFVAATVFHSRDFENHDVADHVAVGMIALFWPLLVVIAAITYPVSKLGGWAAKVGGWR